MKKLLTLIIAVAMLVSTMVFTTNAAGTLIFSDNFDGGFMPRNWITDKGSCHFEWDKYNGCIHGYDDSVVLQSNYGGKYNKWWDQFYGSFDFQVRAFDDFKPEHEGRTHGVSIWYHDLMEVPDGEQSGATYFYNIELETGKAILRKELSWDYYDEFGVKQEARTNAIIAEGNIGMTIEVGEKAPFYEMGIRVTSGKIECYFEQNLILTAEVDPTDTKYGDFTMNSVDASVGSQKSAFLVWNHGNWLAIDNFQIWSPDYDFEASVNYGDADSDGAIKLGDASLMLKHVAGWSDLTIDLTAADVNVDGNVNLTDVSTVLKVVAGWEGVVLGPQS